MNKDGVRKFTGTFDLKLSASKPQCFIATLPTGLMVPVVLELLGGPVPGATQLDLPSAFWNASECVGPFQVICGTGVKWTRP